MLALDDDAALARLVIAAIAIPGRARLQLSDGAVEGLPARPSSGPGRMVSCQPSPPPLPLLHAPTSPPSSRPQARSPPRARTTRSQPRRMYRGRAARVWLHRHAVG